MKHYCSILIQMYTAAASDRQKCAICIGNYKSACCRPSAIGAEADTSRSLMAQLLGKRLQVEDRDRCSACAIGTAFIKGLPPDLMSTLPQLARYDGDSAAG